MTKLEIAVFNQLMDFGILPDKKDLLKIRKLIKTVQDNQPEEDVLSTDELFKALPKMVNRNGNFYHFRLIKGAKRIIVKYKMNDSEGGRSLLDTHRTGKTLNEALKNTLELLFT